MIAVNIVFLGPARDLAGTDALSLDVADSMTVGELRGLLAERFPKLGRAIRTIRFAVNEAFVDEGHKLCDGDEVALIPPVSGGCADDTVLVDLVRDRIDAEHIRKFVTGDPALGGITTFEGATRRDSDAEHGPVLRLEYEAYESMARRQLRRLAGEAKERWGAGRVAIVHRLGPVPPGEASVVIAVACPHRAESFDACRWLIDTLKRDVPIWKKDVFEDGHVRWVEAEGIQNGE